MNIILILKMEAVGCHETSVLHTTMHHNRTELRGLSPRANYTDRATAVCQRFYSHYLLHVSVVRPSSDGNMLISDVYTYIYFHMKMVYFNISIFQYLFIILFKLSATCFGRTTIFRRKYVNFRGIDRYIFPHEDDHTTETCSR
jgi:hypothetical protein